MRNLILAAAFAVLPVMAQAQGQANCGTAEQVAAVLERHSEQLLFSGLNSYGNMLQIWVNADTQTFSVIIFDVNGTYCLIDAGQYAEVFALGEAM